MTDMDRMVVWLRAAMDAAERIAQATTPVPNGKWVAVRDKHDADDVPLSLIQGQYEDEIDPDRQDYSSGMPVIAHAADWQDEAEANLRHIALHDPAAVLRRIAADRKLLDDLLAEKHHVVEDPAYTCAAATNERDGGHNYQNGPCDCGRDARVQRRMRLLAEGYGWTEEQHG